MSLGLWASRSKSTSNIIEESSTISRRPCQVESRSLRSAREDADANRTYLADEIICGYEPPTGTPSKSRNFVKKLVASLERKSSENLHCRANEEFVTKCYRRAEAHHPPSILQRRSLSSTDLPENQSRVNAELCKELRERTLSSDVPTAENSTAMSSFDHTRTRETRRFDSFDRRRLEDRREEENVKGRVVCWSDDELLAKKSREESTKDEVPACMELKYKKKVGRKRSFKDFIGSIVRWRKTDKPRRIRSCDNLDENVDNLRRIVESLPRAVSLQAVIFDDESQDHSSQTTERNATIHPVYGGKRNPRPLRNVPEDFHQRLVSPKVELRRFSAILRSEDGSENLVKPSAIKNMAKRLSQSVDYSWMDQTSGPRGQDKRKSFLRGSTRRSDSVDNVYDVPKLANASFSSTNSICHTIPVDRKLQSEYSAILASGRNNRGSCYDLPIIKKK